LRRHAMPVPSRRLLVLLGVAGALLAASGVLPGRWAIGLVLNGALVLLVAVDGKGAVRRQSLHLTRDLPRRLYTGQPNEVLIGVENRSGSVLRGLVLDDRPPSFQADLETLPCRLPGKSRVTLKYSATAPERGDATFGAINLRWWGPLGLLVWQGAWEAGEEVRVYPRYFDFSKYQLEYRARLTREAGPQRRRTVVRGGDFESLREYVTGDDTRQIDWKATARHQRLIVRNYEEERAKSILLVIDAGRMMAPIAHGLSKLDHALNAALMLCSAAVAKGDRIGAMVFDDTVRTYIPPRGGRSQGARLLEALYHVQPELVEPDYAAAFGFLRQRNRRRSLTVLFTDLIDSAASEALLAGVASLRPMHLPLLVTIRDESLEKAGSAPLWDVADVYRRAVAEEVLGDRQLALARLRARGVVIVDTTAPNLSIATVNRYLALKAESRI